MPENEQDTVETTDEQAEGLHTTVERTAPCEVLIKIEAEADYLRDRYQTELAQLQSEIALPGFRRGKAPIGLVEKRMGRSLKNDVIVSVVGEAYDEACDENELDVVSQIDGPDMEELDWEPGQPFEFEIKAEVLPEVEVTEDAYNNIEIEVPALDVADDMIEDQQQRFLARFATFEKVEDGEVQEEDYIEGTLAVEGTEYSESQGFYPRGRRMGPFEVEGAEEKIVGTKVGETVELTATVEAEALEDVDGLEGVEPGEVKIKFTVGSLMRRNLPELDDDLAEKIGMENADAVREYIREQVEEGLSNQRDGLKRDMLLNALIERMPFEMPESLVDRATRDVQVRRLVNLLRQGVPRAEAEQAALEGGFQQREAVARRLKATHLLRKIAEIEKIYVTESDVDLQIRTFAARQNMREDKARAYLEDRGMLRSLRDDMREEQTIEFLLETAKVKELSDDDWRAKYGASPGSEDSGEE